MSTPLRLRHYFTHFASLGGVQSIIRAHLDLDPKRNLDSSLLAFFDSPAQWERTERIDGLGLTGRNSIAQTRRLFRSHERDAHYDIPIFHDLWGLSFLGEFDRQPKRRIGAIHSQWPHLDFQLQQLRGSLDGVFCDSQAIADYVTEHWPELGQERVKHLPVPIQIAPEKDFTKRQSLKGRRVVLGFVGRLDYAQKRVDRFPPLLKSLQGNGIDCELQFLGTGDASESLPQRFAPDAPVKFWGRQNAPKYWEIMKHWDFAIYTSDHEGSPLAMLEAMSVGNIPLFPEIKSGGDLVVKRIDPSLLYPSENWDRLAQVIQTWAKHPDELLHSHRVACREESLKHSPERYHEKFMTFLETTVSSPRISRDFATPRPFYVRDRIPFGLLKRHFPKAFYQANPIRPSVEPDQK